MENLLGLEVCEFAVFVAEKKSGKLRCWSICMRMTMNMFCWLKLRPVFVNGRRLL